LHVLFLGNVNKSYYESDSAHSRDYNNDYDSYDEYTQTKYKSGSKSTNYNFKKDYNDWDNYDNQRNDKELYDSNNHYGHQTQRRHNLKNYKEDDSRGRNYNYEYNTNKIHASSNRYSNFEYLNLNVISYTICILHTQHIIYYDVYIYIYIYYNNQLILISL
jgi:hypothetical protein